MRGWETQQCAVEGRLGCAMPKINKHLIAQLRTWSLLLARKLVSPVSGSYFANDWTKDIDHWLSQTHYPNSRKIQLRARATALYSDMGSESGFVKSNYRATGFVKDESYTEYKIPRGIHPESDDLKVIMGPLFKAIENQVYGLKWFVKHTAVLDRPQLIMDEVEKPGWVKLISDFSSFEAGFQPETMRAIEFQLYKHALRACPKQLAVMRSYERVATGLKMIHYRDVSMAVKGRRLSGQMCTSLGNTWTNFVLLTFMMKDYMPLDSMRMLVEGDDGICAVPPEVYSKMNLRVPEMAGFKIKMQKVSSIVEASFCGCVFDPEDLVNVTDPWVELVAFGWSGGQAIFADALRCQMLLRAKSMSLAYQYPSCPVLQALARYGLRVTGVVSFLLPKFIEESSYFNSYDREILLAASGLKWAAKVSSPIPIRTRSLVSSLFGMNEAQQRDIEDYLDSLTSIQPLAINVSQPIWRECSDRYVRSYSKGVSWTFIRNARPLLC